MIHFGWFRCVECVPICVAALPGKAVIVGAGTAEDLLATATFVSVAIVLKSTAPRGRDALDVDLAWAALARAILQLSVESRKRPS